MGAACRDPGATEWRLGGWVATTQNAKRAHEAPKRPSVEARPFQRTDWTQIPPLTPLAITAGRLTAHMDVSGSAARSVAIW